jgi:magnesium-transporting ATPase (P-type)
MALTVDAGREARTESSEVRDLLLVAPADAFTLLETRPTGLTQSEVRAGSARWGPNRIEQVRGPSFLHKLAAQFVHVFALLLWAGALLAFVAGMAKFGIAIIAVIILNGIFGLMQEARAERAVEALQRLLPQTVSVIRAGETVSVVAEELVPGDVVTLGEGDRIPADGRLVEASELRIDESSLTGESHPVQKSSQAERKLPDTPMHARNMVFAGSSVISGTATAIVEATGMHTQFGRIARLAQEVRRDPSPLQQEVARVARRVAVLAVGMGVLFFAIGFLAGGLTLGAGAIFAIGIVLGNVPEGLLPTMTLSLAGGVQRMAKRNAVVKRLSSVETLGSCTVICTDKTGTVTRNQMTVREVWADGRLASFAGSGYEPRGDITVNGVLAGHGELAPLVPALRIGHLCNTARLLPSDASNPWRITGDPTEGALLVAAAKAGLDRDFDERLRPTVRRLAFDSERKRMSTVHRALPQEGSLVAYAKGAPRELLAHCTRAVNDGEEVELGAELRRRIMGENDRMARAGMRVLATAHRHLPNETARDLEALGPGEVEHDLVFTGLIGMQDPPRDEVPAAVARCRQAGIRIVMITGDYGLTAEAIAREVGILDEGPVRILSAADLEHMSDEELRASCSEGQVLFARATPEHKLRIVRALRALGQAVAVTGDGVNDAPALRQADIGVAMGRSGTDVAREAADMVLMDDNFATIVAAVEEGRAIFDNMRKFIVYIFAHLSPEAIPFVGYALFGLPLPITVMQILAIDLGTETLPALALGVERPEPDVMRRPPRKRSERLLSTGALLRGYAFLGVISTVTVMAAFFLLLANAGWHLGDTAAPTTVVGDQATTVVFLGIVILQIGNAFACRTERVSVLRIGLFSNRLLLWAIAFELAFTAALMYVPALQGVFGTAPLPWPWWLGYLAVVPIIFALEELRKWMVRRREATP